MGFRSGSSWITVLLGFIGLFTAYDIWTDLGEGAGGWHLAVEGLVVLLSAGAVVKLWRDSRLLSRILRRQGRELKAARIDVQRYHTQVVNYAEGLSRAIDEQLEGWKLTAAEKEVALLLLKGLSLKEVADVRGTSEKTSRAQSLQIYSKSGLGGRAEFAAFFLEDLLVPSLRTDPRVASSVGPLPEVRH